MSATTSTGAPAGGPFAFPPGLASPPPHGARRRPLVARLALGAAAVVGLLVFLFGATVLAGVAPALAVAWLSLPFVFLLAFRPVLRRLAVRLATRRPRETALVLLGSLLGTAIITGSFVVGDTLDASIRRGAFTQLGPVDEVVLADGADAAGRIAAALSDLPAAEVDGVLPLVEVGVAVATPEPAGSGGRAQPTGGERRAEPSASLYEVDFAAARDFGADPEATGIEGPTPTGSQAVLGADLADTLGVGPGDPVEVFAYDERLALTVDRVLPRRGVAGLRLGFGVSESPNVFVAPGTVARLAASAPPGAAPPTSLVAVSNVGGVVDGAERTARVTEAVEAVLAAGDTPGSVVPAKEDLLESADAAGDSFGQLFFAIGFFSVLAGVLLLVNIFVALAQERKTEMGMLRAVGLRRASLVGSFSLEGWLYALGAAALGTLVGVGLGRLIVVVAAGIFGQGDFALELGFSATGRSIQTGFTLGFVIALATVVASSLGIARLNVIRAIRDLPEPPADRRRRLATTVAGALALVLGGFLTATGVAGAEPFSVLGGPGLVALGLVALLGAFVPRRALVTVVSAGVLVWGVLAFEAVPDAFEDVDIPVFVLQGVLLTAAAVALVTQNQDAIGGFVRRLGGGRSMPLRLGLAYPLARRFRTGMILSMYSLVMFTLVFITVLSSLFSNQVDDFTADVSGGFDLQAYSNPANPVPADEVRRRPGVEAVAPLSATALEFRAPGGDDFVRWGATGFDDAYVRQGPPALDDRGAYATDVAAYEAVLADPSLVMVDEFFLQEDGGGPPAGVVEIGDRVTARDPLSGREAELTVAVIAEAGFANSSALVSSAALENLVGERATPNLLVVATEPGQDPQAFAEALNADYLANGADADSFRKIVSENLAQQIQFFRLIQGYLALGLVVGIAGLGVVAVRAVRERRRQVGVLRSLGFQAGAVRRAFLAESGFVALEGIVVGTALALVVAWRLTQSETFGEGLGFAVPWGQLALVVAGTFVASLLATAAPAQQASRIRPAVALRVTD